MRVLLLVVTCIGIVSAQPVSPFEAGYFGYGDRPVSLKEIRALYDAAALVTSNAALDLNTVVEADAKRDASADIATYLGFDTSTSSPISAATPETVVQITPTPRQLNRGPVTFPTEPPTNAPLPAVATTPISRSASADYNLVSNIANYVPANPTVNTLLPAPTLSPTGFTTGVPLPGYSAAVNPTVPSYSNIQSAQLAGSSLLPQYSTSALSQYSSLLSATPAPLTSSYAPSGLINSYLSAPYRSPAINLNELYVPSPTTTAQTGAYNPNSFVNSYPLPLGGQLTSSAGTIGRLYSQWDMDNSYPESIYLSRKFPRKKKTVDSEVGNPV
ncbi:unnamed protein product [Hermetia illucens]|uniref:Uncharacterized protein n=1 Tax=Hermetia illucens TaxID=343691 RepID=A0A7R8UHF3_HERIL|nr:COPII coat assembly protein sec16-like [Hermetia illucens]XP_037907579.1 COPII coat assembly protein sec16-like [Hermetia illucens]CAD7080912.1 unnamed protein product [Hermetia illucens]